MKWKMGKDKEMDRGREVKEGRGREEWGNLLQ